MNKILNYFMQIIEHPLSTKIINLLKKFKTSKSYWSVIYYLVLPFLLKESISLVWGQKISSWASSQLKDSDYPLLWSFIAFIFEEGSIILVFIGFFILLILSIVKISESSQETYNVKNSFIIFFILFLIIVSSFINFYITKYGIDNNNFKKELTLTNSFQIDVKYTSTNKFNKFSLISKGNSIFEVKKIYLKILKKKKLNIIEKITASLDQNNALGEYILQLDNYKNYPIFPITQKKIWKFKGNDKENLTILFSIVSNDLFVAKLCADIYSLPLDKSIESCSNDFNISGSYRSMRKESIILENKSILLDINPIIYEIFIKKNLKEEDYIISSSLINISLKNNIMSLLKTSDDCKLKGCINYSCSFEDSRKLKLYKIIIKSKIIELFPFMLKEMNYQILMVFFQKVYLNKENKLFDISYIDMINILKKSHDKEKAYNIWQEIKNILLKKESINNDFFNDEVKEFEKILSL